MNPLEPPRWAALLLPQRYRDEIVGDLAEEGARLLASGRPRWRVGLWLRAQILAAALAARWHGWGRASGQGHGAESGRAGTRGPRPPENGRGGGAMLNDLARDAAFAVRGLARAPLFTAVAVVTLAAGTGLTLAVYTVIDAVLLTPVDYPDPQRLVMLRGSAGALSGVSFPQHERFRDEARSLEDAAAWQGWSPVLGDADGTRVRRRGASVEWSYFDLVGVEASHGRLFTPSDGAPGHEPVLILAHEFWNARFAADPGAVGTLLEVDGEPYRVVGVAPEGFSDPMALGLGWPAPEMWRADPPAFVQGRGDPGWVGFWSLGRLRPGARLDALTGEMRALVRASAEDGGGGRGSLDEYVAQFHAVTVTDAVVGGVRPTLLVLLAGVVVVLVIGCVNLANLLLSRGTVREREVAVRAALGASRGRLVRQLLAESLVLAGVGSAVGLLLAAGATRLLVRMAGSVLPRADEVSLDASGVAAALAAAVFTALLFGVVPALRLSATGPAGGLAGGRGELAERGGQRLRGVLVMVETALAVVLLTAAGLLLQTLLALQAVDPGFETRGAAVVAVGLGQESFPERALQDDAAARVEEELRRLPGVRAAGAITDLPLSGATNSTVIARAGESPEEARARGNVLVRAVTPGYPEALGLRLLGGRFLEASDVIGAEDVAVVNEEFTRRFFAAGTAVGEVVVVRGVERRIVGVVGDVREFGLTDQGGDRVLYTPYAQEREAWMRAALTFVVRSEGEEGASAPELRAALRSVHPGLTVGGVRPLADYVEAHVRAPRFRAVLVLAFGALALLLTAVGTGGVVAYGVSRRVPELGVRLALGARRSGVQALVLRQTGLMALGGIALGLVLAVLATRVLAGFLVGVDPRDPVVLVTVSLTLLAVALLAAWVPARRASRVDPAVILRRG